MAVKLLAINDVYNIREAKYIVDEENEKDLIPEEDKVQGTRVLVIKGSKEYRMDSNRNWVLIRGEGGGDTLPSVTASDNGKVLGVVNGAWDKVTPSGGGGDLFPVNVTLTYDNTDPSNVQKILTPDKTADEITDALRSGKYVVLYVSQGEGNMVYEIPCVNYQYQEWEDNEFNMSASFSRSYQNEVVGSQDEIALNRYGVDFYYYHPADSDTEYEPSVTWEYFDDNLRTERAIRTFLRCNITWDATANKFVPSMGWNNVTTALGQGDNVHPKASFRFTIIEGTKRYPVISYGLERINNVQTILLYAADASYTTESNALVPDSLGIRLYTWTRQSSADIITYCGSKTISGGSSLPAVTASDNGKVLGVVNGEWNTMDAPNGDFIITIQYSEDRTDPQNPVVTLTPDKTDAEIIAAIEAGMQLVVRKSEHNTWGDFITEFRLIELDYEPDDEGVYLYATFENTYVGAPYETYVRMFSEQFNYTATLYEPGDVGSWSHEAESLNVQRSAQRYVSITADGIISNDSTTYSTTSILSDARSDLANLNIYIYRRAGSSDMYKWKANRIERSGNTLYFDVHYIETVGNTQTPMIRTFVWDSEGVRSYRKISAGGDPLPTVTTSDSGSVFQVNSSGAWVKGIKIQEHDYTVTYADGTTATLKNVEVV